METASTTSSVGRSRCLVVVRGYGHRAIAFAACNGWRHTFVSLGVLFSMIVKFKIKDAFVGFLAVHPSPLTNPTTMALTSLLQRCIDLAILTCDSQPKIASHNFEL